MTDAAKSSAPSASEPTVAMVDVGARVAGRTAQFLLGIPLGLFQLAAAIGFTITDRIAGESWLVVMWAILMSTACAALSLRVYRSSRARRVAFALLAAQAAFSVVKLTVYHESASLVFMVVIAITAATLFVYHRAAVT